MANKVLKTSWFILVSVLIITGCEQQHREAGPVLADPNFVPPDYAASAIEATGGRQSWAKAEKLELDCVVTFHQPDGSFYLTEHHCEIHPWTNSIRISAQEPLRKLVLQLSDGQFSVLRGYDRADTSKVAESYRDFAETILTTITAPVRLLDGSAEFTRVPTPTRIKGLLYYPINRATLAGNKQGGNVPAEPYWSEVIFYQNTDSSLIDTLWFANAKEKIYLLVLGYNYAEVDSQGILAPTKVEIFITDNRGALQKCFAEVNFK